MTLWVDQKNSHQCFGFLVLGVIAFALNSPFTALLYLHETLSFPAFYSKC